MSNVTLSANVMSLARGTPIVISTRWRSHELRLRTVRATRRGRIYLYGDDVDGKCHRAWASQVVAVGHRRKPGQFGSAWL